MFKTIFEIPLYYHFVTLIQVESPKDKEPVKKILDRIHLYEDQKDIYDEILEKIKDSATGAVTIQDKVRNEFVVIIYKVDSKQDAFEFYCHEKRHVEDHLMETLGLSGIESAGYLAGFLGRKFMAALEDWWKKKENKFLIEKGIIGKKEEDGNVVGTRPEHESD